MATKQNNDTKKQTRNDRFSWKKGDVKVYSSVEAFKKANKNKGK